MKRLFTTALLLAALFSACAAACNTASAQSSLGPSGRLVQEFELEQGEGVVDWESGFITSTGIGSPPSRASSMAQARAMAIRAATVVARRNLLEVIEGIQVDSDTTVRDNIVSDDIVRNRMQGFLQHSRTLDTAYMSDGSVVVTVGVGKNGELADILLPPENAFKSEAGSIDKEDQTVTGLVVDARGLKARPALTPRIVDESGREVYGSKQADRNYAVTQGMAGYVRSLNAAKGNPRVAENPLVVKAVAAVGEAGSVLQVSDEDAALIRQKAKGADFLEKCRVMIVLN